MEGHGDGNFVGSHGGFRYGEERVARHSEGEDGVVTQ
jgi:hypothetical protein